MIEIRCLHSLSDALPYRDTMHALNLASARPDPFSTFEFYANHLRHASSTAAHAQLWLLLAFDDDRLVGYLALTLRKCRVLGVAAAKLELLTAYKADRPQLVAERGMAAEVRAAVYAYVLGRKSEWSVLEFAQQDAASPLLPLPAQATSGAFSFRQGPNLETGRIAVRWDSLAEYYAALSRKFRADMRRQMRTLLAAGDVRLLTSSDQETLPLLFELYRSVEAHSWKARAAVAIEGVNERIAYFTELMQPDQPMRITIHVLLLDGAPIAGLMTGTFAKGMYALQMVYDDRYGRLAPGSALLLMGIRLAIAGRYEFFDLLQGFGYYKARWLARMTGTQILQIYRVGSPFYWRRMLGDAKRRWFGAARTDEPSLSNPSRRGKARATDAIDSRAPGRIAEDRARHASLVARVERGRGDFLSSRELVAALPFATNAAPAIPPVPPAMPKAQSDSLAWTGYWPSGTGPANAVD